MKDPPDFKPSPTLAIAREASAKSVVMAADYQLLRQSHFHRLAIATAALDLPRRVIPDVLADAIRTLSWPGGKIFEPSDTAINDAFRDDDSRWLSGFMRFATLEPRQRPQRGGIRTSFDIGRFHGGHAFGPSEPSRDE